MTSLSLRIPKMAVSMQNGTLLEWYLEDGSTVAEGAPLYSLEIEKSVVDVDAPRAGILKRTGIAGETYAVGDVIGEIIDP